MADPLNPLEDDFDKHPSARVLSDKGIKQAIEKRLISLTPFLSPDERNTRIQPATLDVRINQVVDAQDVRNHNSNLFIEDGFLTLRKGTISEVELTEEIDAWKYKPANKEYNFFSASCSARSSLVRLGCFASISALMRNPYSGKAMISLANLTENDIHFQKGERVAQIFFHPIPFADTYGKICNVGSAPPLTKRGDVVRSLDMGIEVKDDHTLDHLMQDKLMEVYENNSDRIKTQKGLILLHATDKAYRFRAVGPEGIQFSKRKEYEKEVLEEINIKEGYKIKPFEQLIVLAKERFSLSPFVGIRTFDNVFNTTPDGRPIEHMNSALPKTNRDLIWNIRLNIWNMNLTWFDPGYSGIVTHFPKNPGRVVRPGDVIGYAQVFYFPNGVERPYGSQALGSQYQNQQSFQLSKK